MSVGLNRPGRVPKMVSLTPLSIDGFVGEEKDFELVQKAGLWY